MSESSSRSAARETTPAPKTAEASAAAPAPTPTTAPASAPAAAAALAHDPEGDPKHAAPGGDEEQDRDRDDPANGNLRPVVHRRRTDVFGIGERDAELSRKRLSDQIHAEGESLPILLGAQRREHGLTNPPRACIGEESFGAPARGDEDVPRARSMILAGHEQHHDAEILAAIAGFALCPHPPLAADLDGDIAASAVIGLCLIPLGLPGLWVMVAGILAYGWLTGFRSVGVATIAIVLGLAFLGEIIDNWLGFYYAKRYGGSTRSGWGALIGGIVGAMIGVPIAIIGSVIGAFLGSFAGAALFEFSYSRHAGVATRAGWGALVGRAAAAAGKIAIGLVIAVI